MVARAGIGSAILRASSALDMEGPFAPRPPGIIPEPRPTKELLLSFVPARCRRYRR
jgi:hypothetical protein